MTCIRLLFAEAGAMAAHAPVSWGLMIVGFGGAGAILRRRRRDPLAWLRTEPKWSPR